MAGLIFLKNCNDWTDEQAVEAYCFHRDVQYALDISGAQAEISLRSLERYNQLFRELQLAEKVFDDVTQALIQHLEFELSQQRLDSTHVYSNMAMYGRTSLMVKALPRLLTQVLRHHAERYESLPEPLRKCYAKNNGSSPFGWPRAKNTANGSFPGQDLYSGQFSFRKGAVAALQGLLPAISNILLLPPNDANAPDFTP